MLLGSNLGELSIPCNVCGSLSAYTEYGDIVCLLCARTLQASKYPLSIKRELDTLNLMREAR